MSKETRLVRKMGRAEIKAPIGGKFFIPNHSGMSNHREFQKDHVYGGIYAYDVSDTISISAAGIANKVQINSFAVNEPSQNCTPDHTNDHITIDISGKYLVVVSIAMESSGAGAVTVDVGGFKNNGATQLQNLALKRRMSGGGGDAGSGSLSGIVDFTAGDTLELWVWNETNDNDVVIDDVTMSITKVS